MKESWTRRFFQQPFIMLLLVAVVMSAAIGGVYTMTKDTIEEAALAAQSAARGSVMEAAVTMEELELDADAPVDYVFEAYDADGNVVGYVSQVTVVGFGGEIEVTVGMDVGGALTAISVGGSNFSETSGLGARTREPAFTEQFRGRTELLVLKQNIDSVSGASVSSGAVVSGVNKAAAYMRELLPEGAVVTAAEEVLLTPEELALLLPGAVEARWMGGGAGIDMWWQAAEGYIVRATGFGEGPIVVTMGFNNTGVVTGIIIGDENFMETEGRGDRVREAWFSEQFIGRSGAQVYGEGVDAISGATVTSDATLAAINACMTFDPAAPGEAAPAAEEPVTDGAAAEPDAEAEATIPEEETVTEEPSAEPDAETEASIPEEELAETAEPATEEPAAEPDAETEASIPEEELAETVEPATEEPAAEPDAETEASIPDEEELPAAEAEVPAPAGKEWRVRFAPLPARAAAVTLPEEEPAAVEPDAETEASIPEEEQAVSAAEEPVTEAPAAEEPAAEPDAETEASIPEEELAEAEEPVIEEPATEEPAAEPDAETEASIPQEEELPAAEAEVPAPAGKEWRARFAPLPAK